MAFLGVSSWVDQQPSLAFVEVMTIAQLAGHHGGCQETISNQKDTNYYYYKTLTLRSLL